MVVKNRIFHPFKNDLAFFQTFRFPNFPMPITKQKNFFVHFTSWLAHWIGQPGCKIFGYSSMAH